MMDQRLMTWNPFCIRFSRFCSFSDTNGDVSFHFFGPKPDGSRIDDVIHRLVERGRIGNVTLVPASLRFKQETALQLLVSSHFTLLSREKNVRFYGVDHFQSRKSYGRNQIKSHRKFITMNSINIAFDIRPSIFGHRLDIKNQFYLWWQLIFDGMYVRTASVFY